MPRLGVRGYLAALPSIIRRQEDDLLFRVYVSDALQAAVENTTHHAGINGVFDYGRAISKRYVDILERKPADTRTGDEIAADVIKHAGLKQKGGEPA